MKKWLSILAAASLMMSMVTPCLAEEAVSQRVPSKTTTETSRVESVETTTGEVLPDTFAVKVTEDAEPVKQEIEMMYNFVNDPEKTEPVAPIEYFEESVQQEVHKQLVDEGSPEDYDMKQLELNEIVTVQEVGYEETYGDVVAKFKFTTEYQAGQKLVGLIGFYSGETNEDGSYVVDWEVVPVEVLPDGSVAAKLTQAQLLRFRESVATSFAVLSEPMA